MFSYSSLDAEEVLEEAERESQEAIDALAAHLQALKSEPKGTAHLLTLCKQQIGTCQRTLKVFDVELRGTDLLPVEAEHATAVYAQQRARLDQLVRDCKVSSATQPTFPTLVGREQWVGCL